MNEQKIVVRRLLAEIFQKVSNMNTLVPIVKHSLYHTFIRCFIIYAVALSYA